MTDATRAEQPDSIKQAPDTGEKPASERLLSLDAYRGLVMLLLAFTAVRHEWAHSLLEAWPDSPWLAALFHQFEHVEWRGLKLWDMIQPSFMFMVGVSMPYSLSSRARRGASWAAMLGHAIYRALVLILLGVFLRSLHADHTNWTFEDVVSQIGLGYVPLFLLWRRSAALQVGVSLATLIGVWALYASWPLPGPDYDRALNQSVAYFDGFYAHWNKNANPGHYLDQWLLNLPPRDEPFVADGGGYNTLNFVPSFVTMLMGLMAGERLRRSSKSLALLSAFAGAGILLVIVGVGLDLLDVCPLVKKVWTPGFTLASGGLCLMTLAFLALVIDIGGFHRAAFPAIVVGRNSIAMYCMTWITAGWTLKQLRTHLGASSFEILGEAYAPLLENLAVGAILWLICLWMHRRAIYLRI